MKGTLPAGWKEAHRTIDCYRWIQKENGTARFPKTQKYQMIKIDTWEIQKCEHDVYIEESESDEHRD